MIQRIQTLYLLAATALMAITFFAPLMSFHLMDEVSTLYAYKLVDAAGQATCTPWHFSVLVGLTTILPFLIIFRYKNRLSQIRFCVVEVVLLVGLLVVGGLYCYRFYDLFTAQIATLANPELFAVGYKMTLLCPVAALLFVWLASRAIFRDEMLVRAADRIR